MKNAFEYEDQLADLREELAEWKARAGRRTNDMGEISREKLELKQRLADAERRNMFCESMLRQIMPCLAMSTNTTAPTPPSTNPKRPSHERLHQ